eukprot:XP_019919831.1 PREDICTED: uncharacterized protein LOC105320761 isoform X1 [Crassostrea gigas]
MERLWNFLTHYKLMDQLLDRPGHFANRLAHSPRVTKCQRKKKLLCTTDIENVNSTTETETSNNTNSGNNISIQTEEPWISPFEMFAMATELHVLREKEKQCEATICTLKEEIKELTDKLSSDDQKPSFGVDEVIRREGKLQTVFKYYTSIVYIRFAGLLAFLVSDGSSVNYEKGRKDIKMLSLQDGLFLTVCRLRHNFSLKDLSGLNYHCSHLELYLILGYH